MILINKLSVANQLRKLAVELDADFFEEYGASRLTLDNKNGQGYINSYDLSPYLSVRTYNITFDKEVRFIKNESGSSPVYFLYNIKGYYYHRFSEDDELTKVAQMQNVIIKSQESNSHVVVFPAKVKLQLSVMFLREPDDEKLKTAGKGDSFFSKTLMDTFNYVNKNIDDRYFGKIEVSIAQYAKLLIENEKLGVVGRLFCKGSAVNTLAAQLENLKNDEVERNPKLSLNTDELDKIIELSSYIGDNLGANISVDQLSKRAGLSPKKLQEGFKYLYGDTINNFIKSVRLEHSKKLIQSTNMSISEVCFAIGFNSRSYFSKIFTERYKISPSEFKQSFLSEDVIFELSYRSSKKKSTSLEDVEDILEVSRRNNKDLNITGCLVNYRDYFFQILEGNKKDVLELYETIKNDERHYEVSTLYKGAKIKRLFGDFSLAALSKPDDFKVNINGQIKEVKFSEMTQDIKEPAIASDIFWMRICNMLKVSDC